MTDQPYDPNSAEEPRLLTRRDHDDDPSAPALSAAQRKKLYSRLDHLQRSQSHTGPGKPRRGRKVLRRIFYTWAILTALTLTAIVMIALSLRHSMRAALPQLDGNVAIPGLSAPVTITRDPQSVPSITAANLDDLLFAQGYVTASDRLFQMDALRRHAAGELAEILGSSLVEHDRLQRTLQIRAAADRAIAVLPPDQLRQLQAYANGINAFLTTHADTLPVEFHLLHYQPAPWTPRDSLLVGLAMNQDLSTEFPQKLNRELLSAHLPAALLADLYPIGSWRDHPPTDPEPDLTTPREEIEQIPLDKTQSAQAAPEDLSRINKLVAPEHCPDCRSGSNNWAVAANRSVNGAPLLSNDMHLSLSAPDIWYEATLHAGGDTPLDATGFTLPGVPFIIAGRNAHVAWAFTAMLADVQDLRIEHTRGSGDSTEYQLADQTWVPIHHHPELIHVRFGRDITLDVQTTTHKIGATQIETPILTPLYPSEHRAISLAWPIYDPSTVTEPYLAINTAATGADLVNAFANFGGPSLSLIYADEHHIGYHALGRIPIRGEPIHHPRPHTDTTPLTTTPDEDSEPQTASNLGGPSSAFLRRVGYRVARDRSRPFQLIATTYKPPAPPRERLKPPPVKKTPDTPILPPAPTLDYTIGNPISAIPVDALDPAQRWSGYIPYAELPHVTDPPSGILATANARVASDDYPYHLANNWIDPYRVERIRKLLSARPLLKPEDMLTIQNDVHSDFDLVLAQRLAYALDHASPTALAQDPKRLHQAADLLRNFNGDMALDSSAATLVSSTRAELWAMLLTPQIKAHDGLNARSKPESIANLYTWNERNTALELLLQHTPARWLPPTYANWDDFLTAAVALALRDNHSPADLAHWPYGPTHPVEIAHPIFGSHTVLSKLLGLATGTGNQPSSGDATTVHASGLHFGPSERFTADLSNPETSQANITTGQSGNPASDHFLDQFQPWLRGTTFTLPLSNPTAIHTLTLTPR